GRAQSALRFGRTGPPLSPCSSHWSRLRDVLRRILCPRGRTCRREQERHDVSPDRHERGRTSAGATVRQADGWRAIAATHSTPIGDSGKGETGRRRYRAAVMLSPRKRSGLPRPYRHRTINRPPNVEKLGLSSRIGPVARVAAAACLPYLG